MMPRKVLVIYATCAESTKGVAEAIGRTLSEDGCAVEVAPMQEVVDLASYDAVVAGSAIHSSRWLPEAIAFVEANQVILHRKPCAVFLVCMTLAMRNAEKYRLFVSDFLEPVRAAIEPVSEGLFAGALDISKVPGFWNRVKFRLSVFLGVWTEGDHRDWVSIQVWAGSLVPLLTA